MTLTLVLNNRVHVCIGTNRLIQNAIKHFIRGDIVCEGRSENTFHALKVYSYLLSCLPAGLPRMDLYGRSLCPWFTTLWSH